MSQPPLPKLASPVGADPEPAAPLDAALLMGGMRQLYKALRERARAAESEAAQHSYREAMEMVEQVIQEQGDRTEACRALSTAIARQVVAMLRHPSS